MGIGDFFKKNLGLQNEEDYEEEFEENEEIEQDDFFESEPEEKEERDDKAFPFKKAAKRSSYNDSITLGGSGKMEFVVVKPKDFGDECTGIAEHMLDKKTVVLNLETTSKESSRRIIDFLSGVAYANHGNVRKVALSTFIIVPTNVAVSGEVALEEFDDTSSYF